MADIYRATQLNAQQRFRRSNKSETVKPPQTVGMDDENVYNSTCTFLNVEAELLKLDSIERKHNVKLNV